MKKKILIVDDEKEMLSFLSRKLSGEDFETLVAYDGYEGLKILAHESVDVIITDSAMSEMDGYTFCRKLKESQELSQIPLVICTGHPGDEKLFRKLGIDDFIVKPFACDYLFHSLERILSQVSHRIKYKKVLVQTNETAGIVSAVQEIKDYGFKVDVLILPEDRNIIEETLRNQSDIVIFNALQQRKFAETIVTSLKSYVELNGLKVILYLDRADGGGRHSEKLLTEFKEYCLKSGADGWIDGLNRESFLNLIFEFCQG